MGNMLISIIVPVYNTEAFLERCLQSLLRQGLAEDEFEIILVNDGSTDGSLQICEKYSKIHDNIRIISQANGGIGAARNTGMSLARGEYVCFVDSDDDLSENGLSEMITYCDSEVDAIRFWCRIVHPHTKDENVKEKDHSEEVTQAETSGVSLKEFDDAKKNAEAAVNALFAAITDELAKGEKVSIVGFGTFEVRDRKEKQVINPQTKQMMTAPASKAPAFKAGQALKNAVNK